MEVEHARDAVEKGWPPVAVVVDAHDIVARAAVDRRGAGDGVDVDHVVLQFGDLIAGTDGGLAGVGGSDVKSGVTARQVELEDFKGDVADAGGHPQARDFVLRQGPVLIQRVVAVEDLERIARTATRQQGQPRADESVGAAVVQDAVRRIEGLVERLQWIIRTNRAGRASDADGIVAVPGLEFKRAGDALNVEEVVAGAGGDPGAARVGVLDCQHVTRQAGGIAKVKVENFQARVLDIAIRSHQEIGATGVAADAVVQSVASQHAKIVAGVAGVVEVHKVDVAGALAVDAEQGINRVEGAAGIVRRISYVGVTAGINDIVAAAEVKRRLGVNRADGKHIVAVAGVELHVLHIAVLDPGRDGSAGLGPAGRRVQHLEREELNTGGPGDHQAVIVRRAARQRVCDLDHRLVALGQSHQVVLVAGIVSSVVEHCRALPGRHDRADAVHQYDAIKVVDDNRVVADTPRQLRAAEDARNAFDDRVGGPAVASIRQLGVRNLAHRKGVRVGAVAQRALHEAVAEQAHIGVKSLDQNIVRFRIDKRIEAGSACEGVDFGSAIKVIGKGRTHKHVGAGAAKEPKRHGIAGGRSRERGGVNRVAFAQAVDRKRVPLAADSTEHVEVHHAHMRHPDILVNRASVRIDSREREGICSAIATVDRQCVSRFVVEESAARALALAEVDRNRGQAGGGELVDCDRIRSLAGVDFQVVRRIPAGVDVDEADLRCTLEPHHPEVARRRAVDLVGVRTGRPEQRDHVVTGAEGDIGGQTLKQRHNNVIIVTSGIDVVASPHVNLIGARTGLDLIGAGAAVDDVVAVAAAEQDRARLTVVHEGVVTITAVKRDAAGRPPSGLKMVVAGIAIERRIAAAEVDQRVVARVAHRRAVLIAVAVQGHGYCNAFRDNHGIVAAAQVADDIRHTRKGLGAAAHLNLDHPRSSLLNDIGLVGLVLRQVAVPGAVTRIEVERPAIKSGG